MKLKHTPVFGLIPLLVLTAFVAQGGQSSAKNYVKVSEENGKRIIDSNGIPDHTPGQFPNRGNPNTISPQRYHYEMPLNPEVASQTSDAMGQPFGVAVNGVPFDPGTAEFWNRDPNSGWNYDALSGKINLGVDKDNAHVQPNGAYHYHGIPADVIKARQKDGQMTLVGWAADGFPIYGPNCYKDPKDAKSGLRTLKSSYRIKEGNRPGTNGGPGGAYDGTFTQDYEYVKGLGDLDECNGRTGVTPEYPNGTYYYVLTYDYPNVPRMFRGTPDTSFERRRPPFGGPPGFGPPGRPGGPGGPGGPPRRGGTGGGGSDT